MKFTQTAVNKLTPPAGKDVTLWDDDMTGFGIRFRDGGEGTYTIKFSVDGKQGKLGLGRISQITLDAAKIEARKHFLVVAQGSSPHMVRAKEEVKKGANFGDKVDDYLAYLAGKNRTPNYIADNQRGLKRYMFKLHGFGLGEITRAMVATELDIIKKNRGTRQAGLCRSYIHGFYMWAIRQGLVDTNPVTGTETNPSTFRSRVLTPAELIEIWRATDGGSDYGQIVRLLMLTGARIRQIGLVKRGIEWKPEQSLIDLPAVAGRSKNKERFIIALSSQATAILERIPPHIDSDFVFGQGAGFEGYSTGKARLDERLGDKVEPWVHHDFRRTFDTLGQDVCKIPPHVADVCLNHVGEARKGVKRHYNHATYLDEKRDAMQKWADYIEALVHGERKLHAV